MHLLRCIQTGRIYKVQIKMLAQLKTTSHGLLSDLHIGDDNA